MTDYEFRMLALEARKQNLLERNRRLGELLKQNPNVAKAIINYDDEVEDTDE